MNRQLRAIGVVLLIAMIAFTLDRISKAWVLENIGLYERWAPLPAFAPYFTFFHSTNTGVAFGLFRSGGMIFSFIALGAIIAIVIYTLRSEHQSFWVYIGLGMMVGGAVGNNLWDRVVHGHVIDFIRVQYSESLVFPTFNVADSAIVVGVIILMLSLFVEDQRAARESNDEQTLMDRT